MSSAVASKVARAESNCGPEELWEELSALMDQRLETLTLTNNQSRILSCKTSNRRTGSIDLRLHWCFLSASSTTLQEVAGFALGRFRGAKRRAALQALRDHFNEPRAGAISHPCSETDPGLPSAPAPRKKTRAIRLQPLGNVFELQEIRDQINQLYFDGRLEVPITWGRSPNPKARPRRRPRRRTIHFGTYNLNQHLIRIHPVLDQEWIPRFVVESVVHHEMLHADQPIERVNGRHRFHTAEFRRRERLFARYEEAEAWLQENLARLLDSREKLRRR